MKSKRKPQQKVALDFLTGATNTFNQYSEEFRRYQRTPKTKAYWLKKLSDKLTVLQQAVQRKIAEINHANGHHNNGHDKLKTSLFDLSLLIDGLIEKIKEKTN